MQPHSYSPSSLEEPEKKIFPNDFLHLALGILLLSTAGYLIYWLVSLIKDFFYHPDQIPLLEKIFQSGHDNSQLIRGTFEGREYALSLNNEIKYVFYVLIGLLLLGVLGKIVGVLVRNGVSLILKRVPKSD